MGYIVALVQALSDTTAAAMVQLLCGVIPPFEANIGRYVTQFLVCLVIILIRRQDFRLEPRFMAGMCFITFLGFMRNSLSFVASRILPLGNLMVVQQTAMFASSAFISTVILRDGTLIRDYFLMVIVLIGAFLIIQPFHHEYEAPGDDSLLVNVTSIATACEHEQHPGISSGMATTLGYILTVILGVSLVGSSFVYRSILNDISPIIAAFWYSLVGVGASIVCMFFFEEPIYAIEHTDIVLLLGYYVAITTVSIAAIVVQQRLTPVAFSLVSSSRFVSSFILQYSFAGIFIGGNQNAAEIVGAILVIGIVLVSVWWNVNLQKVQSDI